MIRVCGRSYPQLPEQLMTCPACFQGCLTWTGRYWQCDATKVNAKGQIEPACRHALALGALFDDRDLDTRFMHSQVDLLKLPLTSYGVELLIARVIRFPGLQLRALMEQIDAVDEREKREDELDDMGWLMRQEPRTGDLR